MRRRLARHPLSLAFAFYRVACVRLLRGETAEAAFERAPDRRKPRRLREGCAGLGRARPVRVHERAAIGVGSLEV